MKKAIGDMYSINGVTYAFSQGKDDQVHVFVEPKEFPATAHCGFVGTGEDLEKPGNNSNMCEHCHAFFQTIRPGKKRKEVLN